MKKKINRFVKIGSFLKYRRKAAGLTQIEVAKELGYTTPQFISNFERGLCAPSLESLPTLVKMYSIPEDEIIAVLLQQHEDYVRNHIFGDE